jgi:hypothetical protein
MRTDYFIIFAPGTGGNHLRNILDAALDCNLYTDTDKGLMRDAHFSSIKNLDKASLQEHIVAVKNNKNDNFFCGHLGEYLWIKDNNILDMFPNRKIIVLGIPEINNLGYAKFIDYSPCYKHPFLYEEIKTIYEQRHIELLLNTEVLHIAANMLFSLDISTLVDFININTSIKTDIDSINAKHSTWIDAKIQQFPIDT